MGLGGERPTLDREEEKKGLSIKGGEGTRMYSKEFPNTLNAAPEIAVLDTMRPHELIWIFGIFHLRNGE